MLKVKNINKKFENFNIKNLSFSIDKGDYFVLLGVSGSGKTLLLEMIAGLINPDSGEIILEGKNITNEKIQKRGTGMVFQDYAVFPHLSVKENIAYPLKSNKTPKKEINIRINELAGNFDLIHLLKRKPATLSGGELQRVALARALALNPKILLLDEPLSSLDVQLLDGLRKLLRNLNKNGQTIIHVTHDYEEAILLANKVGILYNGSIVQYGSPHDVFQHPGSEFVANLTGIKNYFKSRLNPATEEIRIASINTNVRIKLLTNEIESDGYVLIRGEDIIICNQEVDSSAVNNFEGIITEILPKSLGVEIIVDIGVKLAVIVTNQSLEKFNLKEGKKVWLSFKASAVRFLKK